MSIYFKISKFFLLASVFFVVLVSGSTLFPFIVGKYVWFRTAIALALIFFLLGLLERRGFIQIKTDLYGLLKNPLVIAVSVFVLIFLLAGFLGVNPAMSFWSNIERGEGGFQMIHLFIFLFYCFSFLKKKKIGGKFSSR